MSSIILFGAGASYGAGCTFPKAPPLGSQLFPELSAEFPESWGALGQELSLRFSANFESGMTSLWESGSHSIPLLMQQMAVFFAHFRLSPLLGDAYSRLIEALRLRDRAGSITLSSLNYDCLLEIALGAAGYRARYFADRYGDNTIAVWKLHGSCNFLPGSEVQAIRAVSYSSGVSFGTGIRAVGLDEVRQYCAGNTAMYPAMAIYARSFRCISSGVTPDWSEGRMAVDMERAEVAYHEAGHAVAAYRGTRTPSRCPLIASVISRGALLRPITR